MLTKDINYCTRKQNEYGIKNIWNNAKIKMDNLVEGFQIGLRTMSDMLHCFCSDEAWRAYNVNVLHSFKIFVFSEAALARSQWLLSRLLQGLTTLFSAQIHAHTSEKDISEIIVAHIVNIQSKLKQKLSQEQSLYSFGSFIFHCIYFLICKPLVERVFVKSFKFFWNCKLYH